MTVAELIWELERLPSDLEVCCSGPLDNSSEVVGVSLRTWDFKFDGNGYVENTTQVVELAQSETSSYSVHGPQRSEP